MANDIKFEISVPADEEGYVQLKCPSCSEKFMLTVEDIEAESTIDTVSYTHLSAMESKRLGMCSKSLFVVPNHLTGQIGREFMQLYPSANIMVADKKDFEPKKDVYKRQVLAECRHLPLP